MDFSEIEADFRRKISSQVSLLPEGLGRYRVFTPFTLEDGDHLAIVLKRADGGWLLTDEGHTFMHLSYDLEMRDLEQGTRRRVIDSALAEFGVTEREGELLSPVPDEQFGNALFSFTQGLLRISDVTFLSRDRVRSTFAEDFRAFLEAEIPEERRTFGWHDRERDPDGNYLVDCRIEGKQEPVFAFAIPNDDRCGLATITALHYQREGVRFRGLAVFEDQATINRKALARLTDVIDRQFSSFASNRERISAFLRAA